MRTAQKCVRIISSKDAEKLLRTARNATKLTPHQHKNQHTESVKKTLCANFDEKRVKEIKRKKKSAKRTIQKQEIMILYK